MKNMKKTIGMLLIVMMSLVFSMSVWAAPTLNKKTAKVKVGSSVQLKVKGGKKVSWSSSNKAVATVESGKVTGVSGGDATIRVKVKGYKKTLTCKVTVTEAGSAGAKGATTKLDGNTAGMTAQEAEVYKTILNMRSAYPEGKQWTNKDFYEWDGGLLVGGYGCAAFAFIMSDAAFGEADAVRHTNFDNIKTGDIIRLDYNTHSVIVLKNTGDQLVVAEGNYNKTIHWGRVIDLKEVKKTGTYVMTRYEA